MPTADQIRATIDAYVDAYARNDKDAAVALFTDDCEWHDPVGQPPHIGKAGVAEFWDQARTLADAITLVPKSVYVCGDEAAMVFDILTTIGGNQLVMEVVETFRLDPDAKIAEARAYWDGSNLRPVG